MRKILVVAALAVGAALAGMVLAERDAVSSGPTSAGPLEHQVKRAHARPGAAVANVVDWEAAARTAPLESIGALPDSARQRLADLVARPDTPPVLLPERPRLLQTAQVVTGPHWYTVAMKGPDFGIVVGGNSASIDVPGLQIAPEARATPERPRVSRVHDIVTVSFTAWGVAYDVDIECLGGIEHPLCGDDLLALDFVDTLRHVELAR